MCASSFLIIAATSAVDLAYSNSHASHHLHASPSIHLTTSLLSKEMVEHLKQQLPKDEGSWVPCLGQKTEYLSKRCHLLPVDPSDAKTRKILSIISLAFDVDVSQLESHGLPIIRYLPGASPVSVHGDIGANGIVPNATLVVYLTDAEYDDGATLFPHLPISPVIPRAGACLSFQNVDGNGRPDPKAHHGVSRVSALATRDRLVVQIPLRHPAVQSSAAARESPTGGLGSWWLRLLRGGTEAMEQRPRGVAYAEHVSGMKHRLHMIMMPLMLLGFFAYYIYQTYFMEGGADAGTTGPGFTVLKQPDASFKATAESMNADGRL